MRFRLRTLLIVSASFVGAVLGTLVFGPFVGLTPSVPGGPSIAAGLGGLVGLALALILLAICKLMPMTQATLPRYSLRTLLILIMDSQIDYKSAIRLFPEASVWPCAYINGQMHEVCVRSTKTGECVMWGFDCDANGVPLHLKPELDKARLANE